MLSACRAFESFLQGYFRLSCWVPRRSIVGEELICDCRARHEESVHGSNTRLNWFRACLRDLQDIECSVSLSVPGRFSWHVDVDEFQEDFGLVKACRLFLVPSRADQDGLAKKDLED